MKCKYQFDNETWVILSPEMSFCKRVNSTRYLLQLSKKCLNSTTEKFQQSTLIEEQIRKSLKKFKTNGKLLSMGFSRPIDFNLEPLNSIDE